MAWIAHADLIYALTFSPDGRTLASGSWDDTVKLWDLASSEHLQILRRDRPYERLNITWIKGLTEARRTAFLGLGAVET